MALTASEIGLLVGHRLGLPAFERPRLQTLIDSGLEKLARQAAQDVNKRHLLMTDRTSITSTITNTNQDYFSSIATIISTNGVMKDFLSHGTIYHSYTAGNFTADAPSDRLTLSAHGFPVGLKVRLTTSGTLPAGLSLLTDYYVTDPGTNNFKLATSRANAIAMTTIDITDTGSGTHTVTPWEKETVQWLNREVGDLTQSLPLNYIYGWLVDDKLFTNAQAGTFSYTVPFVPTLSTLPVKLENDLIDVITELAQMSAETGEDSK